MRLITFGFILIVSLPGCSSIQQLLYDQSSLELIENRFKELDTILASEIESRDLLQAKNLIKQLKMSLSFYHAREKELEVIEQWVNESFEYQEKIKSLKKQKKMLSAQVSKHKAALKKVRKTLVIE